ncbi:hypothetical protein BG011_001658, partial [Mortierella polycephala]
VSTGLTGVVGVSVVVTAVDGLVRGVGVMVGGMGSVDWVLCIDPAAQTGSNLKNVFYVAKEQVNSKFFVGVTAIEYSINDKNYQMGISIDCRPSWDGIYNIVARWNQGIAAGAQSEVQKSVGYQVVGRDELRV